jgi:nitroreductase
MDNKFETVSEIINRRRTTKPAKMNGKIIPDEQVMQLLALGDMAPTHKHTEPWRFFVYSGSKLKEFVNDHAELYKKTSRESFKQDKYDKILGNDINVSHIIVTAMKRDPEERIAEVEEIAAVSAAIENILIGATAMGISSFWSSGGMTHKDEFKHFLGLGDKDIVMGILYLGYSDFTHEGKRVIPLEEKITWNK